MLFVKPLDVVLWWKPLSPHKSYWNHQGLAATIGILGGLSKRENKTFPLSASSQALETGEEFGGEHPAGHYDRLENSPDYLGRRVAGMSGVREREGKAWQKMSYSFSRGLI